MAATYAQSVTDYTTNSDFDIEDSAAKAKLFIKACRDLLLLMPAEAEKGARGQTERTSLSPELIQSEMHRATNWLARKQDGGQVTDFDLRDFRT